MLKYFQLNQIFWQAPGCTVIFLTGISLKKQMPVDKHIQFVSDTYEC